MDKYSKYDIIHYKNENGDIHNKNYLDTRAEFITVLVRSLEKFFGKSLSVTDNPDFTDVNPDDWYHPYLLKAWNLGILQRPDDGKFDPARPITRIEALLFTIRTYEIYLQEIIPQDDIAFTDVQPGSYDDWIYDAVQKGYTSGLTQGYPTDDGRYFYPLRWAPRSESVAFIHKLILKMADMDGNDDFNIDDVLLIGNYIDKPLEECPSCDLDENGKIEITDSRRLAKLLGLFKE